MAKTIIVADDEEEIVELLRMALEAQGYAVVATSQGAKLPELIKLHKPDLLLLDVLLPGLDGYSLQLQIAQDEATRHIPVIVITALPAARSLFEKFEQVKLFVNKPFDTDELSAHIKEILGS